MVSVSITDPHIKEGGWSFGQDGDQTKDPIFGFGHLHQVYTKAKSDISGRVSVPVLWDKQKETIVNNESAEIIRMFNNEFNVRFGFHIQMLYRENQKA